GLGGLHPETIRNGADHWVRCGLGALGLRVFWLPPAALAVGVAGWAWRRRDDRPGDLGGGRSGVGVERGGCALAVGGRRRLVGPLLVRSGVELALDVSGAEAALRQVVTYLGAGIYEEALFRLVLFSALVWGLRRLGQWRVVAVVLAAVGSATLFSTAHHIG